MMLTQVGVDALSYHKMDLDLANQKKKLYFKQRLSQTERKMQSESTKER